ncbi:uncharacterized protein LOC133175222 [Saccostrea echinata]|uniref:uncharacterized protein LOC133175222 n=1 Tax=Saccostrea echinata TaxID=191078 RepID=UPI002A7FC141|nr:uncharacterized protein LOC133175222 [Saccostrea echinata]
MGSGISIRGKTVVTNSQTFTSSLNGKISKGDSSPKNKHTASDKLEIQGNKSASDTQKLVMEDIEEEMNLSDMKKEKAEVKETGVSKISAFSGEKNQSQLNDTNTIIQEVSDPPKPPENQTKDSTITQEVSDPPKPRENQTKDSTITQEVSEPPKPPENQTKDSNESQKEETEEKNKKLTEEEIQAIKTKTMKSIKTNLEILSDLEGHLNEKGTFNQAFKSATFQLQKCHFALSKTSLEINVAFKQEQGAVFVELGGVKTVCDVIVYCVRKGYYTEDSKLIQGIWIPLVNSAIVMINFTDINPNFAHLLVEHGEFLPQICEALQRLRESHLQDNMLEKDAKILTSYLSIIHNIAQAESSISELRDHGFVEVLLPYLKSTKERVLLSTLATLADLVDETEAKYLESHGEFFTFLLTCLKSSMEDRHRRCKGWAAWELARTIRRIARNDVNKKSLVAQGSLPVLVSLAQSKYENEQIEALGALWMLSFDKENQDIMIKDDAVMKTFIDFHTSSTKKIKNACSGALWNMREKLSSVDKYKELGNQYRRDEKEVTSESAGSHRGHVMISYQWANQKIIKKIRDSLQENGIKCWMDIDDMQGSTLNAMAKAVERADIILICYSKKYYDSPNCRAEAEYAFQLRKPIIPLKMERNYQAREWLGFIIGSKLFFEFTDKYPFESKISALVKEILTRQKRAVPEKPIIPHTAQVHTEKTPESSSGKVVKVQASEVVKRWTESDVLRWINHHKLPSSKFSKLTGTEIAFLQVLRQESPDYFYKTLNEMLKIKDLSTLAQFTFALDDTVV